MVGILSRLSARVSQLSRSGLGRAQKQLSTISWNEASTSKKLFWSSVGLAGATGVVILVGLENSVHANDPQAHAPHLPWSHNGIIDSLDHASMRRGYQVYKQVCAACHSMRFMCYRHLVGATHTEAEAKAEAEENMVTDGPDEEGNMFQRPGKLADTFPNPYANEEAARFANNGAFPPDLSLIVNARHGGEDYIFHLLTGYIEEPPAGVILRDGQYYNPYFPGGAISMAQALYNDVVVYTDGTISTASQTAKDVSTFLRWATESHHDTRKRWTLKALILCPMFIAFCWYWKRHTWSGLKSRKLAFKPVSKRED